MARISRGQTAPSAAFGVSSEASQLMKFGLAFTVDEQDALDGETLGTYRVAITESLRACRQLISDLLWSVVLSNPELADGTALFHADRGNLGSAVLGSVGLTAAVAAMAGQVGADSDGAPIHWNLTPAKLIVPPALLYAGWGLAETITAGGLAVRSESRMSSTGVLNPADGSTLIIGSATNWLLAASGEQKASLVLSLLNGKTEPSIRQFALDGGQWGIGFDISFSCACTAVSGAPLYFSTGLG